ncbi:MAG: hypothetical protein AB7I57_01410 [Pirellulales bacterium]
MQHVAQPTVLSQYRQLLPRDAIVALADLREDGVQLAFLEKTTAKTGSDERMERREPAQLPRQRSGFSNDVAHSQQHFPVREDAIELTPGTDFRCFHLLIAAMHCERTDDAYLAGVGRLREFRTAPDDESVALREPPR